MRNYRVLPLPQQVVTYFQQNNLLPLSAFRIVFLIIITILSAELHAFCIILIDLMYFWLRPARDWDVGPCCLAQISLLV